MRMHARVAFDAHEEGKSQWVPMEASDRGLAMSNGFFRHGQVWVDRSPSCPPPPEGRRASCGRNTGRSGGGQEGDVRIFSERGGDVQAARRAGGVFRCLSR